MDLVSATTGEVASTDSLDSGLGGSRITKAQQQTSSSPTMNTTAFNKKQAKKGLVRTSSFKMKARWEEVDRGEYADALVTALKARVRGGEITRGDVAAMLDEQYPGARVRPSFKDMDNSIRFSPSNGSPFGTGQWAEYYGGDARWHLALIRRVQAKAPLDYRVSGGGKPSVEPKWEYSYNFGRGVNIPAYFVRAPEEALKRSFGMRPFVWLQYALLRVEQMVRFQEHHQRDFEEFSFTFAAESLWEQWLNHPNNGDFKAFFESCPEQERTKLINHLLSVFGGLDRLSKLNAPGSRWDFKNQNISVYTYPSLLGSGWITCAFVLVLQIAIPALLLVGAVETSARFEGLFTTSINQFCPFEIERPTSARLEGLLMNLFVLLLYTIRVAPKILETFYQTTGEGLSPASRLNALRTVVWNRGADTLSMQFGYRLERFVKSCYMTIVCAIMLFTLFLSTNTLDIILNALAIEFVWEIDIECAKSPYWDPRRRWIKAGAVECRIRATLDFIALNDPVEFCREYDIDMDDYKAAFNGEMPSLRNARIAARDAVDQEFMSETDVVWSWAGEIAREKALANANWQFGHPAFVNFGMMDRLMLALGLNSARYSVFKRFSAYRTWSLWEEVLYLSPIPVRGQIESLPRSLRTTREEQMKNKTRAELNQEKQQDALFMLSFPSKVVIPNFEYLNFDPDFNASTAVERFFTELARTLLLQSMLSSIGIAMQKRAYGAIPYRVLDGILEWVSHLIQVLFPVILVGFAVLDILCY